MEKATSLPTSCCGFQRQNIRYVVACSRFVLLTICCKINEALTIKPTTGSIVNAYEHMWGYFKKEATADEKEQYLILKQRFQENQIALKEWQQFLKKLAYQYEVQYLIDSTALHT